MNIKDKVKKASSAYWDALFKLLDDDKKMPLHGDQVISTKLDENLDITLSGKYVCIRNRDNGYTKAKAIRHPSNDVIFPYITLLSWYLKEITK